MFYRMNFSMLAVAWTNVKMNKLYKDGKISFEDIRTEIFTFCSA